MSNGTKKSENGNLSVSRTLETICGRYVIFSDMIKNQISYIWFIKIFASYLIRYYFFQRSDLIGDGKENGNATDVDMSHVYMLYPNENEQTVTSSSGALAGSYSTSNRPRTARSKGAGRPKSSRQKSRR